MEPTHENVSQKFGEKKNDIFMPYWHLKVGMKIWDFWVCDWFVTDRGYVGISMSLRAE